LISSPPMSLQAQPIAPPAIRSSGRLGWRLTNRVLATCSFPWRRRLAKAALLVPRIRYFEQIFHKLSDAEIKKQADTLRGRARAGDSRSSFIAEGFGLCSLAVWRGLGMHVYDVQLAAGVAMFHGSLVELATGEGKTLTAAFPAFLYALANRGVHIATVNDYLARRDAETLGPVYGLLGLSVGVLQMQMEEPKRAEAYRSDITYGTASEFGFDFLRDRLKQVGGQVAQAPFWSAWQNNGKRPPRADKRVQRGHYCALVDEVDSIFVDEARTPLVISAPTRMASDEEAVVFRWADATAKQMKANVHYRHDITKDKLELLDSGRELVRYANPPAGQHSKAMDKLFEAIEKAIQANFRFVRDHHYMVLKDKVVIVDESTGRPMPDRHWREGLHQAVEAKECVPIHLAAEHAAEVTYQSYFRSYDHLCGMSGTLIQNFREIRRVYRRWVVAVPTNRLCIREQWPDAVYPTREAKYNAIVQQVKELTARKRPILIGTRSVEKSEALSELLHAAGISHQVLNAKHNEQEAMIVAQAGRPGCVTVATNMAGRGTDIILGGNVSKEIEAIRNDIGFADDEKQRRIEDIRTEWQKRHEEVVAAGGLHVIGTERHEALRIDRQLLGRAGRQGDPGSGQFFVALDDQILEALGPRMQAKLIALGKAGGDVDWNQFRPWFRVAQRKTERKHYRQRLDMMFYHRNRREKLHDLGADPFVD
jgi:preprotein translocase subunit SecA